MITFFINFNLMMIKFVI